MTLMLLLLLFPAAAFAGIRTEIFGNFDTSLGDMVVRSSGDHLSLISDTEVRTFQLTDSILKSGVLQEFGKAPDFVYVYSPNFWGDMFQFNNWTQVTTIVKPSSAKVLKVVSKPTNVVERIFENKDSVPMTYDLVLFQNVSTAVTSTWVNNAGLTVDTDITYDIKIDLLNHGGVMALSFTSPWGANTHLTQTMSTGSASTVRVPVQPGRTVKAEFHALTATVSVAMGYTATLKGDVVAHYDPEYRGHKFWELPVTRVLSLAGLAGQVITQEVMHITCQTHSRVVVSEQGNSAVKMADVLV